MYTRFCNFHVKIKASGNNDINLSNIGKHVNKIKNSYKNNIKGIRYEGHHNRNEAITAIMYIYYVFLSL